MSLAQLSKSSFFYFILYITPLPLSCLFENQNTISYDQGISFYIYSLACVCVPHLWRKFAFSFMPLAQTLKMKFFQFHIIDGSFSFDLHISEPVMNFMIYSRTIVYAFLICGTSLLFPSYLTIQVPKFSFFNSISYIASLASIPMLEHKNLISYEPAMNFLIYLRALVCMFLICRKSLVSPSGLMPDFQNQVFSIPNYRLLHYLRYHTSQLRTFLFTYTLLCLPSSFQAQVCFFPSYISPRVLKSQFFDFTS